MDFFCFCISSGSYEIHLIHLHPSFFSSKEFRSAADNMSRTDDARLMGAVENAATLRRVDALCYLHHSLKLWLAPHVLFTAMMLVLMTIHIVQVVYFNVR